MKKRLFLIVVLILFLTGCSCTYNLTITDNIYKEEVTIIGEDNNEIKSFNNQWKIPINKEEYNIGTDPSSDNTTNSKIYEYTLAGNRITFKNDFSESEYMNSSAVSKCYNTLNIINREDKILISTSSKVICFEKNPPLNNVVINITVDKTVISSNADNRTGNTYTWRLNKNNASRKDINLVLDNSTKENDNKLNKDNNANQITNNENNDYTMYIFAIIILIVLLGSYIVIYKVKNKEDRM